MVVRKRLFPRRFYDWLCFLLAVIIPPLIFLCDMIIVLPAFHAPFGFWYIFTLLVASFLFFQIVANFVACVMVDTRCDFNRIRRPSEINETLDSLGWHTCDKCEKLAPPRSWHCNICKTCILTRDHHCLFLGCCVGHKNHRYFIVFIFYLLIGASYALVYNTLFIWILNGQIFCNRFALLRLLCPLLMTISGNTMVNIVLFLYSLNILAVVYCFFMLCFHVPMLLKRGVCYERDRNYPFNSGSWKRNLKTVFGRHLCLVWLWPLLKSELPENGLNWIPINR